MYEGKTVAAVVPAYNEEGHIGGVLDSLPGFVDRAYVVDDGSTDGTWAEIRDRATGDLPSGERPRPRDGSGSLGTDRWARDIGPERSGTEVVPIRHAENRGVGAALKTGYRRALEDGLDVTAVVAGDGQTEPDIVERIVAPVAKGRADYAKGNRLAAGDRDAMPRFRQVGNFTLSLLTKIASGYWRVMDPQNGSTAISREALADVGIEEMYEDYGYCNDLLVRLNVAGARIADVPRRAVYEDEESHIRYRSYIPKVSALLLRDFLWRLREKYLFREAHPLVGLYGLGPATAAWGALRSLRRRSDGPLLFVLGLFALAGALVLDAGESRHLDTPVRDDRADATPERVSEAPERERERSPAPAVEPPEGGA
ncbi:glycosyltransferase family 2 protein [Halosegnis marinus]|uniref:Glycosyltransferase family 2 protein n=1 Tax=Halosegnis marinus TaxID=3034023 RepID=A0ABD5ZRK6_9EURY|nr:glycosyltransferase family 2 protein [Halosegnis sp. DT85]